MIVIANQNDGNNVKMIVDDTDKSLLARLRDNGRATIAELARDLNLSRSTVKDRIARLERRGVIKGYSLVLSEEFTKGYVSAHVMVNMKSGNSTELVRNFRHTDQIRKAYAVSGVYDLILFVEAESTGELDNVLDKIRSMEGVKDTLTSVVLSTKFEK